MVTATASDVGMPPMQQGLVALAETHGSRRAAEISAYHQVANALSVAATKMLTAAPHRIAEPDWRSLTHT